MWKRRSLVVLVLVALAGPITSCSSCGEPPASAPDAGPPRMAAQSFRLANGLEVELVSGPCGDEAAIAVLFAVGTDHDPPGRSGMAHVLERILASSAGEGRIVALSTDHTLDAVVVPRAGLLEEIDRVATRMARELAEEEVARARAEVLADVAARHGGDAALTARSFAAESVQPTRGNGWRGGVAAEVEAIDLAQLEAFRRAHLQPGTARMVVAGDVDAAAVRARIERAFASLPAGTPPVAREPADSTVTGTLVMGDAPTVVSLAVPAPPPGDPLHPAFLVLASRLLASTSQGESWDASYDPAARPEALLVTGPVATGEPPEPAAARIRAEVAAILARPLAPADLEAARERFGAWLAVGELEPATCDADPRALAVARARRAQLGIDAAALREALEGTTAEQLAAAVARFEPNRTAAVIAGGAIR